MEEMIRRSPKLWMLTIYLFLFAGFVYLKPSVAFGQYGQIRPFGVQKKDSTIFPFWWWVMVFSIVSYMSIVYVLDYSL